MQALNASKHQRTSTFLFREKGLFSVSRIFSSSLCVRGWLGAQQSEEVVPFGGLPLTSREGGKTECLHIVAVGNHAASKAPSCILMTT